jgi:tetratricopeptide (TPR) repeat protein
VPSAAARPRGTTTAPAGGPLSPEEFQAQLAAAKETYERGLALLKRNDFAAAAAELHKAATATKDPDHIATWVWAQFCAAPDKEAVAKTVRNTLSQSIMKSEKPEIARFFLGRVERMLGREKEALQMFKSVVELDPKHAEAQAEIRAIEARLASEKKSFFQRKG